MGGIGGHARATPDAPALVTLARRLTFAELDERQQRLAGLLHAAGVRPRDRIAVWSSNRVESLEVTTGALRAGIVPVPINALLTPPEATYLLEDSGARWLFTDRPVEPPPSLERVVSFGDAYERCLHEAGPHPIADYALGRPMHYTSGTTGAPKGVWVEPAPEAAAAEISRDFAGQWGLTPDEVHLVCSPLAHSAPHRFSLRTLEAGGTVVMQSRFEARETLAAVELFGVTSTFVVPTHLERIFSLEPKVLKRHYSTSMRMLIHAGAPIRPETKRRAIEFFPEGSVWEFYGSTEGGATRISPEEWLRKPGSVGTPREGAAILIRDERREPVPAGEVGIVWVRDPHAERFSYWGDEKKTRGAWDGDAFTVGDLGRLDEDGYLFLEGRRHDTIISGGVNVYPQEVEAVLGEHPSVLECAVYGREHPEWGQEVCALVVPAPGEAFDVEEVRTWARERLAGFKVPRHFAVAAELPRTATGKVLRREP
ncbi:MAG TPA: AMP-binding protein [Actinomycetota bacterium]|nr:AMP-binding protein [Actinomycetota bacterium]